MSLLQGFRLSPQQRRLWTLQRQGRACIAQIGCELLGQLDPARLERALQRVVDRHEILRTSFHPTPGIPFPVQVIGGTGAASWRAVDRRGLPVEEVFGELLHEEAAQDFDLRQGPACRAALVALAPDHHLLVLTLPALSADRTSLDNLLRELAAEHGGGHGAAGGEEVLQYLQFSEWQNQILEEEDEGADHWRHVELPDLWSCLPRAAPAAAAPSLHRVPVSAATSGAVVRLAEATGTDAAAVLLAAWQVLWWRLTGQGELAVGRVLDGRKFPEMRAGLGLFARAVPVCARLSADVSFRDVVRSAWGESRSAEDWQEYFALEEESSGFALGFELATAPDLAVAAGVSFIARHQRIAVDRFGIALTVLACGDCFELELQADATRFDAMATQRIGERLLALLAGALAHPESPIDDLEVLGAEERRWLLEELNRSHADVPHGRCVPELIAAQVERAPTAIAVRCGDRSLTYAELAARSDRLARRLRTIGVGPESLVAIHAERSPEALVGILAVWKAGGAFVPLDPAHPAERLAFILDDARPAVVLTTQSLAGSLPDRQEPRLWLDEEGDAPEAPAAAAAGVEHLAYVLHTSGSTGAPKGVMVSHGALVNYLAWAVAAYGMGPEQNSPVHSPLSFDLTLTCLLGPLLAGGTVELLPEEQGIAALSAALARDGEWSPVKLTPAHLELLRQDLTERSGGSRIDVMVVGGEALRGESCAVWRDRHPGMRLVNEYGPTETVVGCCAWEVPAGPPSAGPVPIGRPVANARLYLLDLRQRPVPAGVEGEIYIGGPGVARGYLRRADLTAERFVPDPFGGEPGARLYRSGDLARHLPTGELEFLGRNDHQVKIRGYRVELGEIESALVAHPQVREAVALLREDAQGGRRLTAYLVAAGGAAPGLEELRRFLAERLPEHMVPSSYVPLPSLPLTANGKVDRAALEAPGSDRPALECAYVAPSTPVESTLALIWADALSLEGVGVHDNFFSLGGDSMRSVRVVALAREQQLELTIQDLFRHPTIAELAAHLRTLPGPAGVLAEEQDLGHLLDELEQLSDEEVQRQLQPMPQVVEAGE